MTTSARLSDRQKVNQWLDHIGSKDERERDEVMKKCSDDAEARAYFVGRWENDVQTMQ